VGEPGHGGRKRRMRGPEIIEVGSDTLLISMRFLIVLVNALKLKKKKKEANEEFLLGTNTELENDRHRERISKA
jgi:hypothetical protein